jgi:hypothetical protein
MTNYVPADIRRLVASRARFLCEYCLIHERDTFLGCEVDHIISEKHGGITSEDNLAYACVFCNRYKGSDIASLLPTGDLRRFYNPRIDQWKQHFRLQGTVIVPISEIGQVTEKILNLNVTERQLERELLISVARFPSAEALAIMTVS